MEAVFKLTPNSWQYSDLLGLSRNTPPHRGVFFFSLPHVSMTTVTTYILVETCLV